MCRVRCPCFAFVVRQMTGLEAAFAPRHYGMSADAMAAVTVGLPGKRLTHEPLIAPKRAPVGGAGLVGRVSGDAEPVPVGPNSIEVQWRWVFWCRSRFARPSCSPTVRLVTDRYRRTAFADRGRGVPRHAGGGMMPAKGLDAGSTAVREPVDTSRLARQISMPTVRDDVNGIVEASAAVAKAGQ